MTVCDQQHGWRQRAAVGGDWGHLMLGERVVPQSEVIRAMLLDDSPCVTGGVRALRLDPPSRCSVPREKMPPPVV